MEERGALVRFVRNPERELPRALRPGKKLLDHGPGALSSTELLSLAAPAREGTALSLLRRHGLRGLARLTPERWLEQRGLGPATAARLCAVFELGRRCFGHRQDDRPRIGRPRDVYRRVGRLRRLKKEHLVGLYLDAQNALVHEETISIGSLNTTRTHPREILYPAITHLAAGFVLAHNHPSGCLEPSPEDVEFSHAVRRAAELMGIELYDHVIVSLQGYASLRERGLL